MSWEVLDISKYQTSLNYNQVAGGIDGVIIRIGYRAYGTSGTLCTDPYFNTHYNGLAGKTKIGFYWFSTAISEAEAIEEANYCHKLLAGKQCDFPVYFDSEMSNSSHTGRSDNLSKANRTRFCVAWCNRMRELGYRAGVYASDSWFSSHLDLAQMYSGGYSLWVAKYSSAAPKIVSKYDAWQYTSSGTVSGYSGRVDLSHFYNDVAGWSGPTPTPTPTPSEKPVVAQPTLKSGSTGQQVVYLQQDLNYIMSSGLATDGSFGNLTLNALKAFQTKYGLTADGIYGTQSYNKMNELINGSSGTIDINTLSISINPTTAAYTGSPITPTVLISGLTLNTDYTVSYSNNVNPGTGYANIVGIGNYTGSCTKSFVIMPPVIEPIDINTKPITITPPTVIYTGGEMRPVVTINGLTENIDFTVSYSNNINAGTGYITINGIGAYTGTATKTFTISQQNISNRSVNIGQNTFNYTGSPITPSVSISGLNVNSDYTVSYSNNVNVGTATVTCTGIGNYTGAAYANFIIAAQDISGMTATLDKDTWTYTGSAITPAVTVSGLDPSNYDVSYSNNVNVGTGYVIINGKGNYSGSITLTFTINKASISGMSIVLSQSNYVYNGTPKVPDVSVTGLDATNYDVVISNNINAGSASVVVTGKGNYEGTISTSFVIYPRPITDFQMPELEDQYYCSDWIEPPIEIDGLEKTRDYTIRYNNNFNIGEAFVTVTGVGNYTGTATIYFNILVTPISMTTVKYGRPSIYTIYRIYGDPLTITFNDYTLRETIDYNVKDTKIEGKKDFTLYTFVIEGTGGFTDEETYRFRIIGKEPSDIDTTDDGVYNYGDIDEGDETAVGNYDFFDIDPNENYYDTDEDDNNIVVRRNGSVLLTETSDEDEDDDSGDDSGDKPKEDEPSVVIDGYDYDFEAFSHIYLDGYDEDDGTNIDENGDKKEEEPEEPDDGTYNFGYLDIDGTETAVGDYDFGDLDEGVSKDSVADGDYDFNVESEGFPPGTEFTLDNTPIYANYSSNVSTETKSGVYFIYRSEIVNDRIRITRLENGVEAPARCTGWVNIDDLRNLGKFKVGDPVIVSGRVMKYTSGDNNEYNEVHKSLMYVVQISDESYPYPYGVAYGPTLNRIGWVNTDCMERPEEDE